MDPVEVVPVGGLQAADGGGQRLARLSLTVPPVEPLRDPRPEDPLPGDEFLIHPLIVSRLCVRCARHTLHRQVYDRVWARILLRCLRCYREVEAVVTGRARRLS